MIDDISGYKGNYQKYLSEEAMIGPIPSSYALYIIFIAFIALFLLWFWVLVLLAVGFFWRLQSKGITAKEFVRHIRVRLLGLAKPFISHINNV